MSSLLTTAAYPYGGEGDAYRPHFRSKNLATGLGSLQCLFAFKIARYCQELQWIKYPSPNNRDYTLYYLQNAVPSSSALLQRQLL